MKRRKPTRREAKHRAFKDCSDALDRAYRHPDVTLDDLRAILASLVALHCGGGQRLLLTMERT